MSSWRVTWISTGINLHVPCTYKSVARKPVTLSTLNCTKACSFSLCTICKNMSNESRIH